MTSPANPQAEETSGTRPDQWLTTGRARAVLRRTGWRETFQPPNLPEPIEEAET